MRVVKILYMLLILYFAGSSSSNIYSYLCERILFKQPASNNTLASKEIINGVYVKTSKIIDKFPVYKHERGKVYFQYNRSLNNFLFISNITGSNNYIGLGAYGNYNKMSNPNRWVYDSAKRHDNIFSNIISTWFQRYYYPSKTGNRKLDSQIAAQCVHFTDCSFNDLAFTHVNNGKLSLDIFKRLDNVYQNHRQIYTHSTGNFYLFFGNNHWNIGDDYNSNSSNWYVDDHSLKPEFITSVWRKRSDEKWEYQYSAKIECHGIDKTCAELHCQNNSSCSSNSFNRSFCSCPFHYTGTKCENRTRSFCPSNSYTKFLKSYGSLESVFCQEGHFYNTICTRNVETNGLEWVNDKHCKQSLRKKFSLDNRKWLLPTIIFTVFAVQIALWNFISYCFDTPAARGLSLVFYISKYIVQMFNFNPSQKSKVAL